MNSSKQLRGITHDLLVLSYSVSVLFTSFTIFKGNWPIPSVTQQYLSWMILFNNVKTYGNELRCSWRVSSYLWTGNELRCSWRVNSSLWTGNELRCSWRVNSSIWTCGICYLGFVCLVSFKGNCLPFRSTLVHSPFKGNCLPFRSTLVHSPFKGICLPFRNTLVHSPF
jgi:hypothetical protein